MCWILGEKLPITLLSVLWNMLHCHSHFADLAQMEEKLPAKWEAWVPSLGLEVWLEKEMATHSSVPAWKIPWTEEPGEIQSMEVSELDTTERLTLAFFTWRMEAASPKKTQLLTAELIYSQMSVIYLTVFFLIFTTYCFYSNKFSFLIPVSTLLQATIISHLNVCTNH